MNARELKPGDKVLDAAFNQKATFKRMNSDGYYFVVYDNVEFANKQLHPNEDGEVRYNVNISGDEWELIKENQ